MYAVCNIILGAVAHGDGQHDVDELEAAGFEKIYHGGASVPPMYFGLNLGYFDECEELTADDLIVKLTATDKQKKEELKKYSKLPKKIRDKYPFNIHLLWSSS